MTPLVFPRTLAPWGMVPSVTVVRHQRQTHIRMRGETGRTTNAATNIVCKVENEHKNDIDDTNHKYGGRFHVMVSVVWTE